MGLIAKTQIASLLRHLANRLDPPQPTPSRYVATTAANAHSVTIHRANGTTHWIA